MIGSVHGRPRDHLVNYRQLITHYTDGRSRVARSVRIDDPKWRDLIDKAAFGEMARSKVAYCTSKTVRGTFQEKGSVR